MAVVRLDDRGVVVMCGSERRRSAATYQASRALFLLLSAGPRRMLGLASLIRSRADCPHLPNTGCPDARSSGGRAVARPVVPGAVSLVAVLFSTRSKVVKNAMSIATITATAKSKRAVWWPFRSFLMRDRPLIVVCDARPMVRASGAAPCEGNQSGPCRATSIAPAQIDSSCSRTTQP